jgi:hypothetical protein
MFLFEAEIQDGLSPSASDPQPQLIVVLYCIVRAVTGVGSITEQTF